MKLIDKDALVAEIERRKTNIKEYCLQEGHDARFDVVPEQLSHILSFLDTLEVKEVDFDALVDEAFDKYSSVDGYGQLAVSFNRAELYSFIKKIARKEE